MHFIIEAKKLLNAVSAVNGTVDAKSTIPILSNFYLKVSGQILQVRGTNLDIETAFEVSAEVKEQGATTVPAGVFFGILRRLPEGASVECKLKDTTLTIRAGRSRFNLQTLPDTDFPDLQMGDLPIKFDLPGDLIRNMLARVSFAISSEETRYYLNGICLHPEDDSLVAVATDGHRLAKYRMPLPKGANKLSKIIIPRKTCQLLQKLADRIEILTVEASKTKIKFEIGAVTLLSKLIDGTFPDYGRVIPVSNEKLATIQTADLKGAVDRVACVSSERGKAVKLSFVSGKLALEVKNPDTGAANEELEVDYGSDPLDIGFNARYLLDICNQIGTDKVTVKLADPGSPTLFMPAGDVSSLYVLMPMRV